ncbi:MAG: DUF2865 domain-containing protein [Beijerinckiaceae bacterium]|nr:DUF2865 domain-containing protein [Beijerinckiaceae bacterium]
MLRFSHNRVFDERVSKTVGKKPSRVVLTPRSKLALTAGFIVAAVGALLIGPQIGSVLAESDDNASFWRAENARKVAARKANAATAQPAAARREQLPRQASSYAPLHARPTQRTQLSPFSFFAQPGGLSVRLSDPVRQHGASRPQATKNAKSMGPPRQASSKQVCVRLCDGFFFPAPTGVSASDASCATACPNAPTRLYSMRSDRITDAVAARTGAPYANLPVALQYTRVREQTCSCGSIDPRVAIMSDASLRRGDRFMSDNGFLIYQGGRRPQISRRDFTSLPQTRGLPKQERNLLLAMERVSMPRPAARLAEVAPATRSVVSLGPPGSSNRLAMR